MRVGLICVATNKYTRYVAPLWESAQKFFMPDHTRTLYLFTDSPDLEPVDSYVTRIKHEPWPLITQRRYSTMLKAAHELSQEDFLLWVDADAFFESVVGDEIFGRLVATLHPGFAGKTRDHYTYERRPQSRCCVQPHEGTHYFAGGVQGGKALDWLAACQTMAAMIAEDEARGITPLWNDESAWARYTIDHPPDVILSPLYCSPQGWSVPGRKIVMIDKNHQELRS